MLDFPCPTLRKSCNSNFKACFRAILYNPRLTWGAKCLAFAILDLPKATSPILAKLARKLHTSPQQVSVWKKELIFNKASFSWEKN